MKHKIFLLFAVLSIQVSFSQLLQHKTFFKEKQVEYTKWMKEVGLSPNLILDSIDVEEQSVTLLMRTPSTAMWHLLNDSTATDLGTLLFAKQKFLFDLKPQEAKIKIIASDAYIDIEYDEGEVYTDILKKMGFADSSFTFISGALSIDNSHQSNVKNHKIDAIQKSLIDGLETHFKKYEARYTFEDYHFDPSPGKNSLMIEIKNIKHAIFDDGAFEYIEFEFFFKEKEDQIAVDYHIECKHGAGLLWSPKNSQYIDGKLKDETCGGCIKKFNKKMYREIEHLLSL